MTDRELMQQALDALLESKPIDINDPAAFYRNAHAIDALRVRLSQPEEPDWSAAGFSKPPTHSEAWWKHEVSNAWAEGYEKGRLQREWQGLTDEEIEKLYLGSFDEGQFARAIEAKLKEKNHAV